MMSYIAKVYRKTTKAYKSEIYCKGKVKWKSIGSIPSFEERAADLVSG